MEVEVIHGQIIAKANHSSRAGKVWYKEDYQG